MYLRILRRKTENEMGKEEKRKGGQEGKEEY